MPQDHLAVLDLIKSNLVHCLIGLWFTTFKTGILLKCVSILRWYLKLLSITFMIFVFTNNRNFDFNLKSFIIPSPDGWLVNRQAFFNKADLPFTDWLFHLIWIRFQLANIIPASKIRYYIILTRPTPQKWCTCTFKILLHFRNLILNSDWGKEPHWLDIISPTNIS